MINTKDEDKSRLKILRLDPLLIVEVFNWCIKLEGSLRLPIYEEIPKDVEVISINTDWHSNYIELMLRHKSFDVVSEGAMPPFIPDVVNEFRVVTSKDLKEEIVHNKGIYCPPPSMLQDK